MIHLFGDSHSMRPWRKVHGVSWNWTKGTAYKFSKHKDFHINISEPIFRVRDNDFVIFSFGFLDCKSYVGPLSKQFNIKWQDCIDTIAEEYVSAIEINKNKFNNLQIGVLKIPSFMKDFRDEEGPDNPYPTRCSEEERKTYTEYFNEKLKYFCDIKKYKFIDFFDMYINKDGYIEEMHLDVDSRAHIEPHSDLQNYLLKNFKEHFKENKLYQNKTNIGRTFNSNILTNPKKNEVTHFLLSACLDETIFLNDDKLVIF